MKRVGIMGGMGPLATVDLFYKIVVGNPVGKDQEHIPLIIDNYPQIEDRTGYILSDNNINPADKMIESARRLKKAGCEGIAIACNTAHYFVEFIHEVMDIDIIHIVDASIYAIQYKYPNARKVAVLATKGTTAARIYDDKLISSGFEVMPVQVDLQNLLMDCIYKGAKAGKISLYADSFNTILRSIDADIFILACTELPLFLEYLVEDIKYIDANEELAQAIIRYSKSDDLLTY